MFQLLSLHFDFRFHKFPSPHVRLSILIVKNFAHRTIWSLAHAQHGTPLQAR